MGDHEIEIPISLLIQNKDGSFTLPVNCPLLKQNERMVALTLYDEDDREHIVSLDTETRKLYHLGEWWSEGVPATNDIIILTPHESNDRVFFIGLRSRQKRGEIGFARDGLFLGKLYRIHFDQFEESPKKFYIPLETLPRHIFIAGTTGAGKTVLIKAMIEEAAKQGIPSLIIDLKGDLSSLALKIRELSPEEFKPWVEAWRGEDPGEKAQREAAKFAAKLQEFGLDSKDLIEFAEKVEVKIYTPLSQDGMPLALSPLIDPPTNFSDLDEYERNKILSRVVHSFLARLYPGKLSTQKVKRREQLLQELIIYAWRTGISLLGEEGLQRLQKWVNGLRYQDEDGIPKEGPIKKIAQLPVGQVMPPYECGQFAVDINGLLTELKKVWFRGQRIDIPQMIQSENKGKTCMVVINLAAIGNFEDRSFLVAQVASEIERWMREKGHSEEPRLLFVIDEIGGGGGKESYYHSTSRPPSHAPLQSLTSQARSFGVCCIYATQNPSNMSYQGRSLCNTWMIGKLATDRDRKNVLEGMENVSVDIKTLSRHLGSLETGQFLVKSESGRVWGLRERWLYTYHKALTLPEIRVLGQQGA